MQKKKSTKSNDDSELVTKGFLKEEFAAFEMKMDLKFEDAERKAISREEKYHSNVMSLFDKVMERLDIIQTEMTVGFAQVTRKIDNHEKRITKLERFQKSIAKKPRKIN